MTMKMRAFSLLALLALFLMPAVISNPYYVHLVITILIYAVLLFGLDIVVGYTGQVSLGQDRKSVV